MNDNKFLTDLQKAPRKEFGAALYKKINLKNRQKNKQRLFDRRWAYAVLTIALLAISILTFVPSVRAATLDFLAEIAGFQFLEIDNLDNWTDLFFNDDEIVMEEGLLPLGEESTDGVEVFNGGIFETLSQSEVEAIFNLKFQSPTWVPEGYEVSIPPQFFTIPGISADKEGFWNGDHQWFNQVSQDGLILHMHPTMDGLIEVIGMESVTEVQINGQAAALKMGVWASNPESEAEWGFEDGLTLIWEVDGITYELSSFTLDADTLIKIAESMR